MALLLSTDKLDILLTDANDLDISDGLQFTSGVSGVAQGIRIRLQMFKGEWFLDLDLGIPFLERDGISESVALMGQQFNEAKARREFRKAILSTPGVKSLIFLTITYTGETRKMNVSWQVNTVFGDTEPDTLEI